ncbi:MAG TPA: tetratricopeptide repeat protein [Blastocatellia bacterium]|nr:tetratricopeptide repeat protein [Blastocatellia bacterium]
MAHLSDETTSDPIDAASHSTGVVEEAALSQSARYDFTSKPLVIALLLLLVIGSFFTSLSGDFVYDDSRQIVDNKSLGHWDGENLRRVLTRDVWAAVNPELARDRLDSVYYRPIFSLFLMSGYEIVGRRAPGWHLLAVLLHSLTVIAAFLIAEKSLQTTSRLSPKRRRLLAAFAAAVFAVHPVQVESVAWVCGSVGPLSAIFLLAAFQFYVVYRERDNPGSLIASLLLFALALLTKESALALLLIVSVYEFFVFPVFSRSYRKTALRLAPYVLTAIGYFVLRYSVLKVLLGRSMNGNFPDDASLTLQDNLRTLPLLIVSYAKLIVVPFNLSFEYDVGYVSSLGLTSFWLPLAIVGAIGISLWHCWRKVPESKAGIIWIVLPLLPHLSTRSFPSEEIIHDRYLYLSMFGVGLLAATLIGRLVSSLRLPDRALATAAVGSVLVLGVITAVQNRNWQNEDELWNHSARFAPNSRIVHIALGLRAERRQDFEVALREYNRALAINGDIIDALNNSALLYARLGRWAEATPRFERIVSLTPDKAMAHFNLSFAYAVGRQLEAAADELRIAIKLDPDGPRVNEWRARLDQLEKSIAAQGGIGSSAS